MSNEKKNWETIFLSILATFAEKYHVNRVGEKSPGHIRYLGLLKDRYPKAKFIHVIRDPRAVILSFSKVSFGPRNIKGMANLWKSAIVTHRKYAELLGPERYIVVKYEELVLDSERTLRSICKFLNIEFSTQMLEHHKRDFLGFNKRYESHMSDTLKPVFLSSLDKWKSELSLWQIAVIQDSLSSEMNLLGYELIEVKVLYKKIFQLKSKIRKLKAKVLRTD